jgi:triosephosphate isomerase
MYEGVQITPPFFEIGPKAYLYGEAALELAQRADALGGKFGVQILFTPQSVDIRLIAPKMSHVLVFAQHMDSLKVGRGIGSVLPEAVKMAGAAGVLLNHVEKRLSMEELVRTVQRADEVGLATMVCADTVADAVAVAELNPNIIIAESPELIGVGKRGADDERSIAAVNHAIWHVNPDILVLHGAGISSGKDVYAVIAAGAQGTGSTSGILKAPDPFAMLEEMIRSVRQAWDDTH